MNKTGIYISSKRNIEQPSKSSVFLLILWKPSAWYWPNHWSNGYNDDNSSKADIHKSQENFQVQWHKLVLQLELLDRKYYPFIQSQLIIQMRACTMNFRRYNSDVLGNEAETSIGATRSESNYSTNRDINHGVPRKCIQVGSVEHTQFKYYIMANCLINKWFLP